jgi:hypothetical protein
LVIIDNATSEVISVANNFSKTQPGPVTESMDRADRRARAQIAEAVHTAHADKTIRAPHTAEEVERRAFEGFDQNAGPQHGR